VSQIPTHELVSSWCPDCYKIATDAEPRTVEIRYTGPAPLASLVAQSLAADGLDVDWRRPEERRDLESMAAEVAVTLTATGTTAAVRAAIAEGPETVERARPHRGTGTKGRDAGLRHRALAQQRIFRDVAATAVAPWRIPRWPQCAG
jgi:hypothetical protein